MKPEDGAAFLPYGRQSVWEDDVAAVVAALHGDFLTTGPLVRRFEDALAERLGARHAIVCSSGTAALHLATLALGLQPGDVAVVPTLTFLATANCARYCGAEVVFADVDAETGLLTAASLDAALASVPTGKAKAILPVHLGGRVADMPAIAAIAARHGAAVVEDACHALGSTYGAAGTAHVGDCADSAMAVFSTHPVKSITTGEGGVVTTNDAALAARLRRFRSHGMEASPELWVEPANGTEQGQPAPWYYEMAEIGYNYRLTDIACALGLSQLGKLDRFVTQRNRLADAYDRLLAPLAPIVLPPVRAAQGISAWHLYAARIDFVAAGVSRSEVMRRLRAAGVGTQVHYIPVHTQPYYRNRYGAVSLPGAEHYYRRTLSLPLFPAMTEADVARAVSSLRMALEL